MRMQPALNAFITVAHESALAGARAAADDVRSRGGGGALTGAHWCTRTSSVPQGVRTTCGSRMLDQLRRALRCHRRREAQGCRHRVMLGKTNMDEFAMGSSSETSYYGAVKNPWNPRSCRAAPRAARPPRLRRGWLPVATATDTGGSIRQPAALCGVTG
jgi:aspartyl-tRNA(Asn)/glutamyl-tRNA(Gln) amidotransferase subunit A